MEFTITEIDGTHAVVWDPVFTGWPTENLVHGNFESHAAAEAYANTVAKAIRDNRG